MAQVFPTPSLLSHLECARCHQSHDAHVLQGRCPCGGTLLARYALDDLSRASLSEARQRPPGMWRYRELLPVQGDPVTLGEQETPLLFLPELSERWGVTVYLKDDGPLPGGTFKARGAAAGLSRAVELGVREVVMPSAGNAGGAWALYAARAGIGITVTMAKSAPRANQVEVDVAGGNLELVDGTISDAGRRALEISRTTGAFYASTFFEPYRLEGKKTAFLEVYDRLGASLMQIPRTIVCPVGGGVAAVAAAKAAAEARGAGWTEHDPPRLVGVQPETCAPLARAFERGSDDVEPWPDEGRSIAAGLRVPKPSEGKLVLDTIRGSGGMVTSVSEEDIVAGVSRLASAEGVFACPEGAATVPAAEALVRRGALEGPVLLYNTGAGIKYSEELASAAPG